MSKPAPIRYRTLNWSSYRRRGWRKVNLAVDEATLEVRAVEITGSGVGDAPMLPGLLSQIPEGEPIASVTADGAYDGRACRDANADRGAEAIIPPRRNAKLFFNILATFAEFEADLIRMRTREGMAVARAKGKLRGKKPKLSERQQQELRRMYDTGEYSISDLAEVFSISRPTVYRTLGRQAAAA
ncbi:DNA-invertase hin [Paracoccus haematequi]|jgi:Site-specific recombinases, DNA invertase Pin homologs|uniref:DNA-invertase hin n=1 Tax=Paracoccus haematequi TaxID=2491866 RepID=A0A447ITK0_9RHOB|nr:DNA-invertase hin [Paracoccus haematequi]